jgi:hypothetical protein
MRRKIDKEIMSYHDNLIVTNFFAIRLLFSAIFQVNMNVNTIKQIINNAHDRILNNK